jgi:hypothetical protein
MRVMLYRLSQFGRALTAKVDLEERATAEQLLPEPAARAFARMPAQDQRHGLDTLAALQAQDMQSSELHAAALLHDVAKADGVRMWHRVVTVLLRAWRSSWIRWLAHPDPASWRYPFWLQLHHPELSAELAREAGCSESTVELIRYHHDQNARLAPPLDGWLAALQAVDEKY